MTMPKCSSGVIFKHDKSYAVAQTWSNLLCLWVCRYLYTPTQFLASDEMVYENMIKETDKMKLEYKFYEKNLAPKWLEGDYDLHIEGNRMTMTSKDGKKVEARCHPEDDWRLQVGIDELKERMAEAKKPREIKVGDKVRFNRADCYNVKQVIDFFSDYKVPTQDLIDVAQANAVGNWPSKLIDYTVKYVGYYTNVIDRKPFKVALVQSNATGAKFVTDYSNLELVE